MRKHHIIVIILTTLSVLICSGQEIKDKPNVVIIYADDVGYGDVGAYGTKLIH
jgi:hypothetical protein